MSANPGKMQAAFTAGEIDVSLYDRTTLKYFSTGAARMENVVIIPQGGFTLRPYTRHIGALHASATRILPFRASDGSSYDLVFRPNSFQVWDATTMLQDVAVDDLLESKLQHLTEAQQLDTMIIFHKSLRPKRIRIFAPDDWQVDDAPLNGVPRYDYGDTYVNGVSARWQLDFVGMTDGDTVFKLNVSGHETTAITYDNNTANLADEINDRLRELPNVGAGINVVDVAAKINVIFDGDRNVGDGWAVSATVMNKADAAVIATKTRIGEAPGESVISSTRGWPRCGVFYQQRLLIGGFRSLPNAWMASQSGRYYNFDMRFTEADGPFLIPMDVGGGEAIVRMVNNLNLLIFTSEAEYWLAERALSKLEAPNHVEASRNGTREGVPVVNNEGAALFCHANGNVLGELRYTDVDGNFIPTDVSLLAPHLVRGVIDAASRTSKDSTSGSLLVTVDESGSGRIVTLLRQQEVTAFSRISSDGLFKAVACNGRNEVSFIAERGGDRALERMEEGLLLDEAVTINQVASTIVPGLHRFIDREIWAIADGDVFGPYTPEISQIVLPVPAEEIIVGTWRPPVVSTLPPARDIGPNIVLRRKARIHTVHISLIDTTSVAISVNGKPPVDIDLGRYGTALADVPELDQGFTGVIKVTGLRGFRDEPYVTVTQTRPGRFTVRSLTIEAQL